MKQAPEGTECAKRARLGFEYKKLFSLARETLCGKKQKGRWSNRDQLATQKKFRVYIRNETPDAYGGNAPAKESFYALLEGYERGVAKRAGWR